MLLKLIFTFITNFSFAILFNIKKSYLVSSSLGGVLGMFIYLLLKKFNFSEVSSLFFSSIVITIYAEVAARVLKNTATTFLITALIPLVPGGGMYYTMYYLINDDLSKCVDNLLTTISSAGVIAIGVVLISTIFSFRRKLKEN